MGNNEWKSRLKKRTTEAMKKSGEIDKENIGKRKLENLRRRVEELKKQGYPHSLAEDIAKGEMAEREAKADALLKSIPLSRGESNIMAGLASFPAGYKAGKAGSISAGEYGEAQFDEKRDKRVKEYAEANMSGWLQAGEELVYLERLDSWKKRLESSAKGEVHGFDITNAIEIMRMLDSDVDVKDVVELVTQVFKKIW